MISRFWPKGQRERRVTDVRQTAYLPIAYFAEPFGFDPFGRGASFGMGGKGQFGGGLGGGLEP